MFRNGRERQGKGGSVLTERAGADRKGVKFSGKT